MSILEGNIYLPVCFTCNKRFMRDRPWPRGIVAVCGVCSDLNITEYYTLLRKAQARQAEMKYKKD